MNRLTLVVCAMALFNVVLPAGADEISWGELKAKNLTPLSKEELEALLPGATYEMMDGNTYTYWKLEADGQLSGETKNQMSRTGKRRTGTWSVNQSGAYCVDAKGQTDDDTVKWCRHVWKIDDKYFATNRNNKNDTTRVVSFALKK